MLVFADSAHDDGITWLGQAEIAKKALISRTEVDRSVKDLEVTGEIEKRKAQRGRRRINVYRITLPGIDEPAYDDLPFTLNEPFTVSQVGTPSEIDGVTSGTSTVSHPDDPGGGASFKGLNRNLEPSGAKAPESERACPELTLIDGRNVGLDALAEECSIKQTDAPGMRLVALGVAGRKARGERQPGVRETFWVEASEWAEQNGQLDRLDALPPEEFEQALAKAIHRKAELYRARHPGMPVTPKALLEWWVRLSTPSGRGGLTADEVMRQADSEAP